MSKIAINISDEKVRTFCEKWSVQTLSLFGSVLSDDFNQKSDIDVLVSFIPNSSHTLFDLVNMKSELMLIFRREVDLISRRGLENSRNYIRKEAILNSAEEIYAS